MSETLTPIKCTHNHIVTDCQCNHVRTKEGKVVGYRLSLRAVCGECGQPFHFPNYIPNENEQLMNAVTAAQEAQEPKLTVIERGRKP